MARNGARVPSKQASQSAWQHSLRAIWFLGVTLVLVAFTWDILWKIGQLGWHSPTRLLGYGLMHALLAYSLERSLSIFINGQRWRYRLAFLGSASLPILMAGFWLLEGLITQPLSRHVAMSLHTPIIVLAIAGIGAFVGGMFASGMNNGFWENNFPPSSQVKDEVHQWHVAAIGHPGPVPLAKRSFDFILALAGLLLSAPIWLISTLVLWLEDPGPVLFVKNSVGRGGVNLRQFKFRTMVCGAENDTGPVLSGVSDKRVLRFGWFLRKTALDELPQLVNILRGEMSFVGPRPQRTVLVHDYLQTIPNYAERHCVLPGLAGLAQVAGDYYLTPHQKLRFDRLYIRHTGLGFDLKLLLLAGLITFWFRWQPSWNGRLPRRLLRLGSRRVGP